MVYFHSITVRGHGYISTYRLSLERYVEAASSGKEDWVAGMVGTGLFCTVWIFNHVNILRTQNFKVKNWSQARCQYSTPQCIKWKWSQEERGFWWWLWAQLHVVVATITDQPGHLTAPEGGEGGLLGISSFLTYSENAGHSSFPWM